MGINQQLFEDILSGKLTGNFTLRNGEICSSTDLHRNNHYSAATHPYMLGIKTYTSMGFYSYCGTSRFDIINFIPNKDMKENELTIEIPDGKIVDWDESKKQNKIVLKDKQLTYGEVCRRLFGNQDHYLIESNGSIEVAGLYRCACEPNASEDRHQLECILAKNKLANVAKYLNDGWEPGRTDLGHFDAWVLYTTPNKNFIGWVKISNCAQNSNTLFKSPKLAQQAIEILGKETVKLALEPLGI